MAEKSKTYVSETSDYVSIVVTPPDEKKAGMKKTMDAIAEYGDNGAAGYPMAAAAVATAVAARAEVERQYTDISEIAHRRRLSGQLSLEETLKRGDSDFYTDDDDDDEEEDETDEGIGGDSTTPTSSSKHYEEAQPPAKQLPESLDDVQAKLNRIFNSDLYADPYADVAGSRKMGVENSSWLNSVKLSHLRHMPKGGHISNMATVYKMAKLYGNSPGSEGGIYDKGE